MKKMLTALLAAAVAGALFIAAPLTAAPPGTEDYNKSDSTTIGPDVCGTGNSLTVVAPSDLWPPNHKYYEELAATATDAEGQAITLTTMGTHDQYDADTGVEQNGSGNTADDITVDDHEASFVQEDGDASDPQIIAIEPSQTGSNSVTTDWKARAERSGRDQTGRTYTFDAIADFVDGDCSLQVLITVPHDMRRSTRFPDEEPNGGGNGNGNGNGGGNG